MPFRALLELSSALAALALFIVGQHQKLPLRTTNVCTEAPSLAPLMRLPFRCPGIPILDLRRSHVDALHVRDLVTRSAPRVLGWRVLRSWRRHPD